MWRVKGFKWRREKHFLPWYYITKYISSDFICPGILQPLQDNKGEATLVCGANCIFKLHWKTS